MYIRVNIHRRAAPPARCSGASAKRGNRKAFLFRFRGPPSSAPPKRARARSPPAPPTADRGPKSCGPFAARGEAKRADGWSDSRKTMARSPRPAGAGGFFAARARARRQTARRRDGATMLLRRRCCDAVIATPLLRRRYCDAAVAPFLRRRYCDDAVATPLLRRRFCDAVLATPLPFSSRPSPRRPRLLRCDAIGFVLRLLRCNNRDVAAAKSWVAASAVAVASPRRREMISFFSLHSFRCSSTNRIALILLRCDNCHCRAQPLAAALVIAS